MITAASTRRGHETLLTSWTSECLVLGYYTTADGCVGPLKTCVEPGQTMGPLKDCRQLEPRMQRQASMAARVKQEA